MMECSQECDDVPNLDNEARVSSLVLLGLIAIHLILSQDAIVPHHPSTHNCLLSSRTACKYDVPAGYLYNITKGCWNCTKNIMDCYRPMVRHDVPRKVLWVNRSSKRKV